MEVKAGYKQTEIGIIPEDWEVVTLGDVAEIKMCKRIFAEQTSINGDIPFYKIGTFGKKPDAYISEFLYREYKSNYSFPRKGDILLSAAGTLGRTVVYDGEPSYYQDSNIVWLDVDKIRISNKYLFQYYKIIKWASPEGSTISRLYNGIIRKTKIVLPSLPEQEAIAKALSDADALIEALEGLIAKKRQVKQGAMQELLRPKENWVEKRLGNTAVLKARIGWQGLTTKEYFDTGDYYLITGTEFKNGYIDWESCHYVNASRYKQDKNIQVREHDVLVTKDGTIGKVALITDLPKPATLNSGVFVIRPLEDAFHPEFFYYLLCSNVFTEFLNQLSAGSTINHLYQKDFVNFVYQTPPTLEEQTAIAETLNDMDAEIAALEGKLSKARQVKQGMMSVLLSGKVRLV